jgi:hypothetical protein
MPCAKLIGGDSHTQPPPQTVQSYQHLMEQNSLELSCFLLAVSHIILVVDDDLVDSPLPSLLRSADALRPGEDRVWSVREEAGQEREAAGRRANADDKASSTKVMHLLTWHGTRMEMQSIVIDILTTDALFKSRISHLLHLSQEPGRRAGRGGTGKGEGEGEGEGDGEGGQAGGAEEGKASGDGPARDSCPQLVFVYTVLTNPSLRRLLLLFFFSSSFSSSSSRPHPPLAQV